MKKLIIFLSVLLFLLACRKESFDIHNLNHNYISVIGHGGMGIYHTYPMNTFEAIQCALAMESDGVEIDVQMTRDSVLVAFHQERLEDATHASGRVYEKTWDEIKGVQYNYPVYGHYQLVSLDDVFTYLRRFPGQLIFLDCKNFKPDTSMRYVNTFTNALIRIIDKHNLNDCAVVELKREKLIRSLKTKEPDLQQFVYTKVDTAIAMCERLHLEGIVADVSDLSKNQVNTAHEKGLMVAVFNAHTKQKNKAAIEKNVDFVQTDKVKYLLNLLR